MLLCDVSLGFVLCFLLLEFSTGLTRAMSLVRIAAGGSGSRHRERQCSAVQRVRRGGGCSSGGAPERNWRRHERRGQHATRSDESESESRAASRVRRRVQSVQMRWLEHGYGVWSPCAHAVPSALPRCPLAWLFASLPCRQRPRECAVRSPPRCGVRPLARLSGPTCSAVSAPPAAVTPLARCAHLAVAHCG